MGYANIRDTTNSGEILEQSELELSSCLNSWVILYKIIKLHISHENLLITVRNAMHCSNDMRNLPFSTHSFPTQAHNGYHHQFRLLFCHFSLIFIHL